MRKSPIIIILFTIFMVVFSVFYSNVKISGADNPNAPLIHRDTTTAVQQFSQFVDKLYNSCQLADQGLDKKVFEKGMIGYLNLKGAGAVSRNVLSIVDFTKKSTEERLWVIDLDAKKVLEHSLVAHGRNTGENVAEHFSNIPSSNMSSLGFYVTQNKYSGKHGLSLVIDGKDAGFNDNARNRSVVVHGAPYVSADFAKNVGRIGRSEGCPALPQEIAPRVINEMGTGSVIFLYYPDQNYLSSSQYLNRDGALKTFESSQQFSSL